MAKTRKSSNKKDLVMRGVALTAGIGVGALAIPKLVALVDKNGTVDPKIVSGVGAAGAFLLARTQKGLVQDGLMGVAAGQAWNLVASFVGISGIGYDDYNASSDLQRIAAAEFGASRETGGTV